ncbi:phospholipid--sterol O-acyltransferase isoform X3, partial [Tanacetum coccineum]
MLNPNHSLNLLLQTIFQPCSILSSAYHTYANVDSNDKTLLTICEGGAEGSEVSDGDVLPVSDILCNQLESVPKNRRVDNAPLDKRRKLETGRIMASTTSSQGRQALALVTTNQKEVAAASSKAQPLSAGSSRPLGSTTVKGNLESSNASGSIARRHSSPIVKWCIEFGIEANAILAVPYDWRLYPSKLEERDLYFHKLKLTFKTALKLRGGPSRVFAHSLDDHIHAYFAVGMGLLFLVQFSGFTLGLPVPEAHRRKLEQAENVYKERNFVKKVGNGHIVYDGM